MKQQPKPKPAGLVLGYVRVSTDQQADRGVSLAAQESRIRALATAHNLTLADVLVDAGASAGSLKRPELARLLALVNAGKVATVVIFKLDRLTRSVKDLGTLLELFERKDVALVSVSDSLDTKSAAGRLVINIMGTVAAWEREVIGERTREALAHKRRRNERIGGLPFGSALAADGVHLQPAPGEQRTLSLLRRLRASGLSLQAVADRLNTRKLFTRSGSPWRKEYVFYQLAKDAAQERAA